MNRRGSDGSAANSGEESARTRGMDRHLATYDLRTSHTIEVEAPQAITYAAARNIDLGSSLPVAILFGIRTLPRILTGKSRPSRSITLDTLLEAGVVILEERGPEEIVLGIVGKFWRPDSGLIPIAAEEFGSFDEPDYAKGTFAFIVKDRGSRSLLETETRVSCTDERARRKFSLYWRLIGPFSGLIRELMLRQIRSSAENDQPWPTTGGSGRPLVRHRRPN